MKRWMAALLCGLMLIFGICSAQATTYTYERDGKVYMTIERFEEKLPAALSAAMDDALRESDEILCGTIKRKQFYSTGNAWETSALIAVKREDKILLMHAGGMSDDLDVVVETDSFLRSDQTFDIEVYPDDEGTLMTHMISVGDMRFAVSRKNFEGMRLWIWRCRSLLENGDVFDVHLLDGHVGWSLSHEGDAADSQYENVAIPARLAAWTADSFPGTAQELETYIQGHQVSLPEDEAYIFGVNLRQRATGQSPSWGKYTAKVRVLGKEQGSQSPWFHVQVGNLTGWASGLYLVKDNGKDPAGLMSAAAEMHDVGRVLRKTDMYAMPDQEAVTTLIPDTLVHVLGERDGWLHVIVPRGKLSWQTDWEGVYGFVKAEDMAVGVSAADVMWK